MTLERFDLELIEAARQGDPTALTALLRIARPQVRRIAERRCLAHVDDATQETLWTLHQKLPTLRSVTAFPFWLLRIVARACLGLVGPLWRRIETLKEEDAETIAHGLPLELRIDLAHAVDALPEIYRDAIRWHYYEDLPIAEIALRLGITEGAAKVRLHRARELLRTRLDPRMPAR